MLGHSKSKRSTPYLGQLSPIDVVMGIKLKNERVIDLRFVEDFTVNAEKEHEKEREKIASVDLQCKVREKT